MTELTTKEIDLIYSSLKLYIRMGEVSFKTREKVFTEDESKDILNRINTARLLLKKIEE